jgi:hypothetical protein
VPALVIPKEYERGFAVVKSFTDDEIGRILKVLKDASPASRPSDVLPILRPALPTIPEEDVEEFLETLYSLYLFRSHSDVDIGQFVEDLSEAIQECENEEVRAANASELNVLKSKFKSLLTVHPLSTLSKAHGLRTDFANVFSDAKVISDIRPVWDGDVKAPPEGIVITHTLKIEYGNVGGAGELYLYIDKKDIERLISVLVRAQEKTATLQSLAKERWMKTLDE